MTAEEHARTASAYLSAVESRSREAEELTEDERLQMMTLGGWGRFNASLEWTCALAAAHAVTSLALFQAEAQERRALLYRSFGEARDE